MIMTVDEVVCAMNSIFNKVYLILNSVSETLVYHLFPILAFFPYLILVGLLQIYNLVLSAMNLKYFLQERDNAWNSDIESDKWKPKTEGWWLGLFWLIVSACTLGWVAFGTTPALISFLVLCVLVSALSRKALDESGNLVSAWSNSWKSMQSYSNSIMLVFSLFLVNAVYECFGSTPGNFSLVLFVIGILFSYGPFGSVIAPEVLKNFTNIVGNAQNQKECKVVNNPHENTAAKPKSFLSSFGDTIKESFTFDPNKLQQEKEDINKKQEDNFMKRQTENEVPQ
jgi:hypothetical protein